MDWHFNESLPIKNGFYWIKDIDGVSIIEIDNNSISFLGNEQTYCHEDINNNIKCWYGPILPPEIKGLDYGLSRN